MINKNVKTIQNELNWFTEVLDTRMALYFEFDTKYKSIFDIQLPDIANDASVYATFLKKNEFDYIERLSLILALIPHIKPKLLDKFLTINPRYASPYTEFGGLHTSSNNAFKPTGETLAFIAAGDDLDVRIKIGELFEANHMFFKQNIINLEVVKDGESFLSGALTIESNYIDLFTKGKHSTPVFSSRFPAKLISTQLNWDDLVLDNHVLRELNNILLWIKHKDKIHNSSALVKHGYKALFYGESGTGKTLAATLIGKYTKKDVYMVDLSKISTITKVFRHLPILTY